MKATAAGIVALAVLIVVGIWAYHFTRLPQKLENDLANDDYRVYSAFLRAQLKGNPNDSWRVGPGGVPIVAEIKTFPKPLAGIRWHIASELQPLEPETFDAFQTCAPKPYVLDHKLDVPTDYELISRSSPPGELGEIQFSCIGFNRARTQAFFYVELIYCPLCGGGEWVLMRKKPDGSWEIYQEAGAWAS
jgi:hypothetical protein